MGRSPIRLLRSPFPPPKRLHRPPAQTTFQPMGRSLCGALWRLLLFLIGCFCQLTYIIISNRGFVNALARRSVFLHKLNFDKPHANSHHAPPKNSAFRAYYRQILNHVTCPAMPFRVKIRVNKKGRVFRNTLPISFIPPSSPLASPARQSHPRSALSPSGTP